MSGPVDVRIKQIDPRRDPPGLDIFYDVSNSGQDSVWLVNDGSIIWSQTGGQIEISLARGRMNPTSAVFGYFVPATVEILPGATRTGSLTLSWPLDLDRLWNRERSAHPPLGSHDFTLRIGYGLTPFSEDPVLGESVESSVLRWQKEAVSAPVSAEVT